MAESEGAWKSAELLAYTEREGPGRPPAASPRWVTGTLVVVVGVTFAGLVSSDTLCPDHRAWVQLLASVGFAAVVGALVGLVRGWATAPVLTLFACANGVAIGLVDAVHSPTRGRLVALGFGVAAALAAVATVGAIRLSRWDRHALGARTVPSGDSDAADEVSESLPDPGVVQSVGEPPGLRAER